MKTMTLQEFHDTLRAQGVISEDIALICPRCRTIQSGRDLIAAGAGEDFAAVEKYTGFSCVGRWDGSKGCDWTLGGLLKLHELEVITPDGEHHPRFVPATPAEAQAHARAALEDSKT